MKQYRYLALYLPYMNTVSLVERFPNLELSYETYAHKKVLTNYDICLAIPTGKKLFAWITYDADAGGNACYLVELNKQFKIGKIDKLCALNNLYQELALGTLLYGTYTETHKESECKDSDFDCNDSDTKDSDNVINYFIVEDMYYFKGLPVKHLLFGEKLTYIHNLFSNYRLSNFALPYMCLVQGAESMLESLSFYESITSQTAYTTHHIQFRSSSSIMPYLNHTYKKKQEQVVFAGEEDILFPRTDLDHGAQMLLKTAVFNVKADLQNDVYHLYANNNVYVNIAYIGSIALSKYMNSLFRNIRENDNIDYGEESEDEDTFQNVRPDKYVDLQKSYIMNCVYNAKFKKWVPVSVVSNVKCVDIALLTKRSDNNRSEYKRSESNKYFNNLDYKQKSNTPYKPNTHYKPYNAPYKSNTSYKSNTPNKSNNVHYKSYNAPYKSYSKYGSSVNSST